MELREYLELFKKNWVLIILMTVLGATLGVGYSLTASPKYQSKTQLYVSVRSNANSAVDMVQGANFSRQIVNSYVDVIRTDLVLDPVIRDLNLDISASTLATQVQATSPKDTALINVSVTSKSPEEAAAIANSIGRNFKEVVERTLETSLSGAASPVNITTTQVASPPTHPISPNFVNNILFGLLGGLVIGFIAATIRGILDTRIHSLDDVRQVTNIAMLGGVIDDPDVKNAPLTIRSKPGSPRAESFRALRTNLQFVNVNQDASIFVMTSANPGEGKSTTSANLALALAEGGAKVALIEADLRLPMVHNYMGVEGGAGLTDILIGMAEVEDVLQRWGRTSLYFLPAGRIPPNPSELLSSEAMNKVLDKLGAEFDFVIVDAPPILSVTDAAVIGHGRTGVLVAVAAGATRKPELEGALAALQHAGANVLGIVVTMLPAKTAGRYGYGNYGYGAEGELEAATVRHD